MLVKINISHFMSTKIVILLQVYNNPENAYTNLVYVKNLKINPYVYFYEINNISYSGFL